MISHVCGLTALRRQSYITQDLGQWPRKKRQVGNFWNLARRITRVHTAAKSNPTCNVSAQTTLLTSCLVDHPSRPLQILLIT